MSVDLPGGWQVVREPVQPGGPAGGSLCLHSPSDAASVFGCAGIEIDYGSRLPGAHTDAYAPNVPDGWYPATDVEPCPYAPAQVNGQMNGIETRPGMSKGLRPVGAHKADWNRWTATCASGHPFHPQAWYLPTSHVVIFDYTDHTETAALLASAKFASDGDALPAMPTYLSAHRLKLVGSTLTVQPFITYTENAAGKAYAKAHGIEYPFLDDYYDADTGPTRTITMASSTACVGNEVLTGGSDASPVPCSALMKSPTIQLPLGIWLGSDGTPESVTELFRP
jgi:hypothetical protein